jgi:HSP20 family protein
MANVNRYVPSLRPSMLDPDGFNSVLRRFFGDSALEPMTAPLGWIPPCEITETKDTLVLTAELPGIPPEDVHLSLEDDVLTIRGERRSETRDQEAKVHLVERNYGSFARSFTLPRSVEAGRVTAEWRNGILTVTMPKSASAKGRVIDIAIQK